jgi:drug/metabolite transporter (DMT)-like permease
MMEHSGGPLSSAADSASVAARQARARRQGIALVVVCTALGAAGQVLIKTGAERLVHPNLWTTFLGFFTVPPLFAGYCLYALMTVIFIFALKDGELSILYPIISLTYVWVAGLSVWFFHDTLNWAKLAGIVTIVTGVAVLGKDAHK